jgi:hypothetical protein
MGGYATWELAMKHPELFAAIAPVCGGGDTTNAWRLRNMGIWNFHGAKDDVVFPSESDKMIRSVKRYNPSVRYTLYPHANHNSWDITYDNDSLYQWMLSKKKFVYQPSRVNPVILKRYTGTYVDQEKDTISIGLEGVQLFIKTRTEKIPLHSAGDNLFYVDPPLPLDFRFLSGNQGVYAALFMGGHKSLYRRIR